MRFYASLLGSKRKFIVRFVEMVRILEISFSKIPFIGSFRVSTQDFPNFGLQTSNYRISASNERISPYFRISSCMDLQVYWHWTKWEFSRLWQLRGCSSETLRFSCFRAWCSSYRDKISKNGINNFRSGSGTTFWMSQPQKCSRNMTMVDDFCCSFNVFATHTSQNSRNV